MTQPEGTATVRFVYTNYRGEVWVRTVTPIAIRFGSTEWHPTDQWLMRAYDHDKRAEREFALLDCGFVGREGDTSDGLA